MLFLRAISCPLEVIAEEVESSWFPRIHDPGFLRVKPQPIGLRKFDQKAQEPAHCSCSKSTCYDCHQEGAHREGHRESTKLPLLWPV